jgi:Glycosyltransferase
MKKIAVLGWELPPIFTGGLGIHTLNLYQRLAKFYDIDLYLPYFERVHINYPFNLKFIDFRGKFSYSYESSRDFYDIVRAYNEALVEKFDMNNVGLIHAHDWITFIAASRIKQKYHIPLVITFHSTEYDRSGNFYPQKRIIEIEQIGIDSADTIITVSNYTKCILLKNYKCAKDNIVTIYNGVELELFYVTNKDYNLKNQIIYFGRLTPQKGPKFFIEAAIKVLNQNEKVKFILAGRGEEMDKLKSMAAEYLNKNIFFEGFVSLKRAKELYAKSDAFVLPAVSEPFGITVLEAMVAGTPIIASKNTGVAEALKNILISDFWDTDLIAEYIISLLKYKALRKQLGEQGKFEAMKFNWDRTALNTLEVYKRYL